MTLIHYHNSQVLQRLLSYPKTSRWSGVSKRQIIDWYENRFVPETSQMSSDFYLTSITHPEQSGGVKYVRYTINQSEYYFKFSQVRAESIGINQNEYSDGAIYFLSLLTDNNNFNCIHLILQTDSKIGLIQGVTKKYPCVGVRYQDKLRVYPGPKEGDILVQAIIMFSRQFKTQLEIDQLELDDSATFICHSDGGHRAVIDLSVSNQLQGKLPFYMKYEFQPVRPSALKKIKHNLSLVKSLRVEPNLIRLLEQITHNQLPDWMLNLINQNIGNPMTELLALVSRTDCTYYAKFYRQLYDRIGLFQLEGEESTYRLIL